MAKPTQSPKTPSAVAESLNILAFRARALKRGAAADQRAHPSHPLYVIRHALWKDVDKASQSILLPKERW